MSHEVHNMMEELVEAETEKLFDSPDIRNEPWFSCGCPQCRGDVICYVLNRLQPKYIRSGRGISHHTNNGRAGKFQTDADITALVLEGIQKVSLRKRPHSHGTEEDARDTDTAPRYGRRRTGYGYRRTGILFPGHHRAGTERAFI